MVCCCRGPRSHQTTRSMSSSAMLTQLTAQDFAKCSHKWNSRKQNTCASDKFTCASQLMSAECHQIGVKSINIGPVSLPNQSPTPRCYWYWGAVVVIVVDVHTLPIRRLNGILSRPPIPLPLLPSLSSCIHVYVLQ